MLFVLFLFCDEVSEANRSWCHCFLAPISCFDSSRVDPVCHFLVDLAAGVGLCEALLLAHCLRLAATIWRGIQAADRVVPTEVWYRLFLNNYGSLLCGWSDSDWLIGVLEEVLVHCSCIQACSVLTSTSIISWSRTFLFVGGRLRFCPPLECRC